jgi:hypothetical protein
MPSSASGEAVISKFRWLVLLIVSLGAVLASGCARTPPGSPAYRATAEGTLRTFLALLAEGKYGEASGLYGGPVDVLQGWFPDQDPQDVAGLLQAACSRRLLQCLPVRSIQPRNAAGSGEIAFDVQFNLPGGTLFVRGPCCGATSTEMPDESTFTFRARPKTDGDFVILDLPPYVP